MRQETCTGIRINTVIKQEIKQGTEEIKQEINIVIYVCREEIKQGTCQKREGGEFYYDWLSSTRSPSAGFPAAVRTCTGLRLF